MALMQSESVLWLNVRSSNFFHKHGEIYFAWHEAHLGIGLLLRDAIWSFRELITGLELTLERLVCAAYCENWERTEPGSALFPLLYNNGLGVEFFIWFDIADNWAIIDCLSPHADPIETAFSSWADIEFILFTMFWRFIVSAGEVVLVVWVAILFLASFLS